MRLGHLPFGVRLAVVLSVVAASNFTEADEPAFKPSGEVRLRHDLQSSSGALPASGHQDRLAAKAGVTGVFSERARGEARISSGLGRTSLNQTLGENNSQFSNSGVTLDRASLEYQLDPQARFLGGRFRNVHHHPGGNDLLFDTDLNFDGWSFAGDIQANAVRFFGTTVYSWMRKGNTTSANPAVRGEDIHLGTVQFGLERSVAERQRLTGSIGWFYYDHLQGSVPVSARGNTVAQGTYAYSYRLGQAGVEYSRTIGDGLPLVIGADFIRNFAAPSGKNAWIAVLRVGDSRRKGAWAWVYDYRSVQKDAIVGSLTEGEVVNGQGTDSRAHRTKILYGLDDRMSLSVLASRGKSHLSAEPQREDRYQFDWTLGF